MEPFAAALHHDALLGTDVRYVFGHHGEKHDLLVQDLVMREIQHQRGRRAVGAAIHEHSRSWHANGRLGGEIGQQQLERNRLFHHPSCEDLSSSLPGTHYEVQCDRDYQRHPSTVPDLERIGSQERQINHQE